MAGHYERQDDVGAYLPTEEEMHNIKQEIKRNLGYIAETDEDEKRIREYLDTTPEHQRRKFSLIGGART